MAAEVVAGILAHSLALLSDAAHMLTDAGALGLSLLVIRLVARPARGELTFGLKRTEILSAQANGAALFVLAGLIVYEGVHRLISSRSITRRCRSTISRSGYSASEIHRRATFTSRSCGDPIG